MSGFKREYDDPKKAVADLLKVGVGSLTNKGLNKIPGYKKVKDKLKNTGFDIDIGKDKVGISFSKKF